MSIPPTKRIIAAGTVTLHRPEGSKQPRVLLVHRPRYDDWSLPKGKAEPGESLPMTAVRETFEETGVNVRLDTPLNVMNYQVGGGEKTVSYWRASVTSIRRHKPNDEVDKVVWLTPKVAMKRLSYTDEREMLAQALSLPDTTPVLIVRHGKAMLRKHWTARDSARPLNARGRQQAEDLEALLRCYHVENLASSTSTRCMATLQPYAKAERLDVRGWATLSEEQGEGNEPAVTKLITRLALEAAESGRAIAICGHRPVLPTMLEAAAVVARPMQTGEACVVHLTVEGDNIAIEWHRPLS